MAYIRKHNYITDEDNLLIAFTGAENDEPVLYIIYEGQPQVCCASEADDQPESDSNPEEWVRPDGATDITMEEFEEFHEENSSGEALWLTIEKGMTDGTENEDYAVMRFIDYFTDGMVYGPFLEAVEEIFPYVLKSGLAYLKALESLPERTLIWDQYWVGMMDSEKNEIFAWMDENGALSMEYVDHFGWQPPEDLYEYFGYSNLRNELVCADAHDIKDKEAFISAFAELLAPLDAYYLNKIDLQEMSLDEEDLASGFNSLGLPFALEAADVKRAIDLAFQNAGLTRETE